MLQSVFGQAADWQLTTMLGTITFVIIFSRFPLFNSLIEGVIESKNQLAKMNRIYPKVRGPLCRPSWPFWGPLTAILDFLGFTKGIFESKILQKLIAGSNNLGFDNFPDPVNRIESPGGHIGFSRRWSIPGIICPHKIGKKT